MLSIQGLVEGLTSGDHKHAYRCLKSLQDLSGRSNAVYPFLDVFVGMLDDENSYIRTRGLLLIAANAKWDVDHRIDEIIGEYLKHVTDDKPITARQCIRALPLIARHKSNLKDDIEDALRNANIDKYKESMRLLVLKDIEKSLDSIRGGVSFGHTALSDRPYTEKSQNDKR